MWAKEWLGIEAQGFLAVLGHNYFVVAAPLIPSVRPSIRSRALWGDDVSQMIGLREPPYRRNRDAARDI
jgi:hypothetical protein